MEKLKRVTIYMTPEMEARIAFLKNKLNLDRDSLIAHCIAKLAEQEGVELPHGTPAAKGGVLPKTPLA